MAILSFEEVAEKGILNKFTINGEKPLGYDHLDVPTIMEWASNNDANEFIGGREKPYLKRWYLLRSEAGNVYLHNMLRHDDDRHLHNHPWAFRSFMFRGSYIEHLKGGSSIVRHSPDITNRASTHFHRLELFTSDTGNILPAWTLVFTGPKVQEWGFLVDGEIVHWKKYIDELYHGDPHV